MIESQWKGKKVAFLGDSITDKAHIGTTKNYWQYLEELLGIQAFVYGINGDNWAGMAAQAKRLKDDLGDDIDAISIFTGTNDFNGSIPLGVWYDIVPEEVNNRTTIMLSPRRHLAMTNETFRGRINIAMDYIKSNFTNQQVFLLTPIHRAFFTCGPDNVQPDESFPNKLGCYVDEYINALKEAANVWAVPVIDLNSLCGLFPLCAAHEQFFNNKDVDKLHPNASGHYRMAKAIAYQLQAMPSDFK